MPIRIPIGPAPGIVVEGHRGQLLEKSGIVPQPKDSFIARNLDSRLALLPPRKPQGLLPSISIRRATSRTVFASPADVRHAVNRISPWDNDHEIVTNVKTLVERGIREAQLRNGKPVVVLMGEAHDSNVSMIAQLAAMKTVGSLGAPGKSPLLLLEQPPDNTRKIRDTVSALNAGTLKTPPGIGPDWAEGTPLRLEMLLSESSGRREGQQLYHDRMLAKTCLAGRAGLEPQGFDTLSVGAADRNARETAMVQGVMGALHSGSPAALVVVGSNHVAALHEGLKDRVNLVALSEVHDKVDTPWERKAMSYTFSMPDIHKFRGSADLQEGRQNFVDVARSLDLAPPPPWVTSSQVPPAVDGEPNPRKSEDVNYG